MGILPYRIQSSPITSVTSFPIIPPLVCFTVASLLLKENSMFLLQGLSLHLLFLDILIGFASSLSWGFYSVSVFQAFPGHPVGNGNHCYHRFPRTRAYSQGPLLVYIFPWHLIPCSTLIAGVLPLDCKHHDNRVVFFLLDSPANPINLGEYWHMVGIQRLFVE